MKKSSQFIFLIIVTVIGIIFVYSMNKNSRNKLINAPKIRKKTAFNLNVKTISFERNGLYLNKKQYNSGGISWYSKFHLAGSDSIYTFDDIKPPFTLQKSNDSDTLKLLQNNRKLYLLISEELQYDKLDHKK